MGKKRRAVSGEIITVNGPWSELLLVCRKCGDKLGGGFGPKQKDDLSEVYKQVLRQGNRRREVRIFEVGCLGVCPKGGVTIMHSLAPGEMLVVPRGLEPTELAARLASPSGAAEPLVSTTS